MTSGAVTVFVAAGLLAACGSPTANQPAHHTASAATVYRQFAQCVRDHGDPSFPDPTVDSHGNVTMPDVEKPSDAIMQACQSILGQLPGGAPSPRNDLASLRQFAQCMRAHGITDWPDPASDGSFPLSSTSLGSGDLKNSPRWPQIQAAWRGPCEHYIAASGGSIAVS